MKKSVLMLGLLLIASQVQAQVLTTYKLKLWASPTATAPIQTVSAPASAATCNEATLVGTGVPVGPHFTIEFDDTSNQGKFCHIKDTAFFGGAPIPMGTFVATLSTIDDAGVDSGDSGFSNSFQARALLPSPKNVRVIGGK